jgi:hypothetical protein
MRKCGELSRMRRSSLRISRKAVYGPIHFLSLHRISCACFLAQSSVRAQAPANIVGGTLEMTISNGATPFASAGVLRFVVSRVANTYTVVPVSGNVGGSEGVYAYSQRSQDSAVLDFNDSVVNANYQAALSFVGANSGNYTITNTAFPASYQSGRFVFYPGQAPAIASATSRSLYLETILWGDAANTVSYFTTYDGTTNMPLHEMISGVALVSGELQPVPGQNNSYRTDYINSNPSLGFGYAYGSMILSIPSNDSDTNSIPDIFQVDKAGTAEYTGTLRSDHPTVSQLTTRGTLTKEAGMLTAVYSMTISDASGRVLEQGSGIHLGIGSFTGSVNYSRGATTNTMDLVLTGSFANDFSSEVTIFTASTGFTVPNLNQVSVPAFTARTATGVQVQIAPFILTRQGRKYSGTFQFSDGRLDTAWPDFKEWRLELLDTNDANGNGIPDLSDGLVGSLQVNLAPAGAVSAGAQWQVDGGAFQNSGAIFPDLFVGPHTIAFKPVTVWITPAPQTVTINANQTTISIATYVLQPGSLQVNLGPTGAVTAGAQWQVDGGVLQNNGVIIPGLTPGSHTVVFKKVNGWATPLSQTITINANQLTTATGTYAEAPRLTIVRLPNQQIVARFPTTPGFQYRVQAATTLSSATQWADFQTLVGTGATVEVTLRAAITGQSTRRVSPARLFRLKIE